MKLKELREKVEKRKLPTTAKRYKGRKEFALYLIDYLCSPELEVSSENLEKVLLNGAENWKEYSEGGLPYAYDEDIANALYPPGQAKKMLKGDYNWLKIQEDALRCAFELCMREVRHEGK